MAVICRSLYPYLNLGFQSSVKVQFLTFRLLSDPKGRGILHTTRKIKDLTLALMVFNQTLTKMLKFVGFETGQQLTMDFQNHCFCLLKVEVIDNVVSGLYFF